MFKEKVYARADGRTTEDGPWHKLDGLWPVELTSSFALSALLALRFYEYENSLFFKK